MVNSIFAILSQYDFELRENSIMWWGEGSLVWGTIAEVRKVGHDLYEIHYRKWLYNSFGDCECNINITKILRGAELLQFVFEKVPI